MPPESNMLTLDDLPATRRKVEQLARQAAEAAGATKQLLVRLKEVWGVETIPAGDSKLQEIQASRDAVLAKYNKRFTEFKVKHKKVLEPKGGGG